jgi:hypothetical protein
MTALQVAQNLEMFAFLVNQGANVNLVHSFNNLMTSLVEPYVNTSLLSTAFQGANDATLNLLFETINNLEDPDRRRVAALVRKTLRHLDPPLRGNREVVVDLQGW